MTRAPALHVALARHALGAKPGQKIGYLSAEISDGVGSVYVL